MIVGSPTKLNLIPSGIMPVVYINQGDAGYDKEFLIYNGDSPYNVPAGVSATIRGTKADGYGVTESATVTTGSNLVTVTITEQMVAAAGKNLYELVFVDTNDLRVASINMVWAVKPDALGDAVISDSDLDYVSQAIDRIQNADAMKNQLNVNTAAIEAETTARIAADNALQSELDAEEATRATQDAVLSARMDTFASLPSGSTSGNAELLDIRVGADGIAYASAGVSVRSQFDNLGSALSEKGILTYQWSEYSGFTTGGYINTGVSIGSTISLTPVSNGAYAYIILPVKTGEIFKITGQGGGGSRLWAFTDNDYKLLSNDAANYNLQTDVIISASSIGYLIVNVYTPKVYSLTQKTPLSDVADAVNTNTETLANLVTRSPNLLDPTSTEAGTISSSGTIIDNPDYNHSADYVSVQPGAIYTSRSVAAYALYTEGKTFISRIETNSTSNPWTFTLPANCAYVKASSNVKDFTLWRLNKGPELVDADYGVVSINNDVVIHNVARFNDLLLPIPKYYHVIGHSERMHIESLSWAPVEEYIYDRIGSGSLANGQYLDYSAINDERDTSTIIRRLSKTNGIKIIDVLTYQLKCVQNSAKSGTTLKAMLIGDSTIASGVIAAQLMNLFGKGSKTLQLIGSISQTINDSDGTPQSIKIEGRSGWSTNDYCYNASSGGVTNPFYNNGFDFSYYMTQTGFDAPDWVFIQLGINDRGKPGAHSTAENLLTMVNSIHAYNASIKVGVCLVIPPYLGAGKSAEADYNHVYRLNQNADILDTFESVNNVVIVPINAAINAKYGFPTSQVAEGDWITTVVTKPTDQTHPSANGYYQIADMYYATYLGN